MNKILIVVCLIIGGDVLAQPLGLIPYRKGLLWGYASADGKIVIQPTFERTYFFSGDSVARVRQGGKYGFIDFNGNVVIKPQYFDAGDFIMGVAAVRTSEGTQCINLRGEDEECIVVDAEPDGDNSESNGFVLQSDSTGHRLIIESTGDTIADAFDEVRFIQRYFFPKVNHFALVRKKDRWGAYNRMGILMAPIEFQKIDILDMDSYKAVREQKWGVNSVDGKNVVPFEYDSIVKVTELLFLEDRLQKNNHFIVSKKNKYGVLDDNRKAILKTEYDHIKVPPACACPTEYVVKKGNLAGLADFKGNFIIPMRYSDIEPFRSAEVTMVTTISGKAGYVNRKGFEYFSE